MVSGWIHQCPKSTNKSSRNGMCIHGTSLEYSVELTLSTCVWAGMLHDWCLLLYSLTFLQPSRSCLRREEVSERRDLVSLLNWYSLAHHCHLSQLCGNTMEGSMVVSSELAYVVVPKRRKQPTQQQGNQCFFKKEMKFRHQRAHSISDLLGWQGLACLNASSKDSTRY